MRELFIADQLDEFCTQPASLLEALQCLASDVRSVKEAAQELGVSSRTLQRLVKNGTKRPPYFWLSLKRIRHAAQSLCEFDRLADAAAAFHFSDQAHMTREMQQWLGGSPSQVQNDTELLALLQEPGYG